MVRRGLRIPLAALADDKIWSVWRAIDENGNGFLCTGEFHRFIKGSLAHDSSNEELIEERMRVRAEASQQEYLIRAEEFTRQAAEAASRAARAMDAEAARLEALLEETSPLRSRVAEKPLSKYEPRHMLAYVGRGSPTKGGSPGGKGYYSPSRSPSKAKGLRKASSVPSLAGGGAEGHRARVDKAAFTDLSPSYRRVVAARDAAANVL